MGDSLQLAILARRQERERILNIGRADRVMAQLILVMFAQPQSITRQAQVLVPRHSPIAPVLVPLPRRVRMAEELNLHLLEFARPKREIPRRDLVPKTLAGLRDPERNFHARAVANILEVDEDALGRFRP